MPTKQPLILTSLESLLCLIVGIMIYVIPVYTESVCPSLCSCKVSDNSEVINCNAKNLTSLPFLSEPSSDQTNPVVDLYISRNKIGYILRHSFYSLAERLRLLEITENGENIEIVKGAFEPFRKSLKVLRIGPLSGNINEQLNLFSPLTSLTELTISSCSEDSDREILYKPVFSQDSDPQLEVLVVNNCRLWDIQNTTFQQLKLKVLNLSNNKFTAVPRAVISMIASSLTHLYMANNSIITLKYSYIPNSCKLSVLDLSFNSITSIDTNALGKCPHLQVVNLSYNTGLVSIHPSVFSGLTNLIIDLDHTRITYLNFIHPDQLVVLRIEGSKMRCTCELQMLARQAFGSKVRGTCVNIDDATGAEDKDIDISFLDLDCHKDATMGKVFLEDDTQAKITEDFNREDDLSASQTVRLETTDFQISSLPSPVRYSPSKSCSQQCDHAASFDASAELIAESKSNSNPKEESVIGIASTTPAYSYIDYLNGGLPASLLFSVDLTKPQKPDGLPSQTSKDASLMEKSVIFSPILFSMSFASETSRIEQSSFPSLQFPQSVEEFTAMTESELIQEGSVLSSQPTKEPPCLLSKSKTLSTPLCSSVFPECKLTSVSILPHTADVSLPEVLPTPECRESASYLLQPSQVVAPADLSKSRLESGSLTKCLSREEAEASPQRHADQVTVASSVVEPVRTSSLPLQLQPVEDRYPFSCLSSGELESDVVLTAFSHTGPPFVPQVGSTELPQQTGPCALQPVLLDARPHGGLTSLPKAGLDIIPHMQSTALLQSEGSSILLQQAGFDAFPAVGFGALPHQASPKTLPQQASPDALPYQAPLIPSDEALIAAGSEYPPQEPSQSDRRTRLRFRVELTESMESSRNDPSDTATVQSISDLPAITSYTSTSHFNNPQQLELACGTEQSRIPLPPESLSIPHQSSSIGFARYRMRHGMNSNTPYPCRGWRKGKIFRRISLKSAKDHSKERQPEVRPWILRCPVCVLACFIHGCLTFAAFLTIDHGRPK